MGRGAEPRPDDVGSGIEHRLASTFDGYEVKFAAGGDQDQMESRHLRPGIEALDPPQVDDDPSLGDHEPVLAASHLDKPPYTGADHEEEGKRGDQPSREKVVRRPFGDR